MTYLGNFKNVILDIEWRSSDVRFVSDSSVLVFIPMYSRNIPTATPNRGRRWNITTTFETVKTVMVGLPVDEKSSVICLAVSKADRRVTDGQTSLDGIIRAVHSVERRKSSDFDNIW